MTTRVGTGRLDLRERIQRSLADFLALQREHMSSIDETLLPMAEAVEIFVLGGGKRLRPAFAIWGYLGAGGPWRDEIVSAVSTLELVQAGALIHDDLIDASDTRRGEPSVHRRFEAMHRKLLWSGQAAPFGSAAALLLGDLCLVWSDEMLDRSGLPQEAIARARPVFNQMRTEVMLGQYLDVHSQAAAVNSMERASLVAKFKSAKYSVEHPLLFGAALAGASPSLKASYSAFGLPLGEAFQLRDDVLGVFGDPVTTGKPAGDDLREGKRTYLVAAALAYAVSDADRELLAKSLGDPRLDEQDVARLREIIVQSGALERTEARITELMDTALTVLGSAEVTGEAAAALRELAAAAVHRST
jgi:geranylgeranyl diphosphate synthase type I